MTLREARCAAIWRRDLVRDSRAPLSSVEGADAVRATTTIAAEMRNDRCSETCRQENEILSALRRSRASDWSPGRTRRAPSSSPISVQSDFHSPGQRSSAHQCCRRPVSRRFPPPGSDPACGNRPRVRSSSPPAAAQLGAHRVQMRRRFSTSGVRGRSRRRFPQPGSEVGRDLKVFHTRGQRSVALRRRLPRTLALPNSARRVRTC